MMIPSRVDLVRTYLQKFTRVSHPFDISGLDRRLGRSNPTIRVLSGGLIFGLSAVQTFKSLQDVCTFSTRPQLNRKYILFIDSTLLP